MKTVKLITCNDAMKAHILQGALENEGIESILHNENFSTLYKSCVSNIAVVFFNTETKEIIEEWITDGKARGFGLRNYWAGSIYSALKKL